MLRGSTAAAGAHSLLWPFLALPLFAALGSATADSACAVSPAPADGEVCAPATNSARPRGRSLMQTKPMTAPLPDTSPAFSERALARSYEHERHHVISNPVSDADEEQSLHVDKVLQQATDRYLKDEEEKEGEWWDSNGKDAKGVELLDDSLSAPAAKLEQRQPGVSSPGLLATAAPEGAEAKGTEEVPLKGGHAHGAAPEAAEEAAPTEAAEHAPGGLVTDDEEVAPAEALSAEPPAEAPDDEAAASPPPANSVTRIVPFGKEDVAQELQTRAASTQDTLVDAIENAEVAEIKRSVFRSLTRLRAAEIKEFDTIARLETQAIDEYNDAHHYRKENPLEYIHSDEPKVGEDKNTAFHN